MAFSRSWGGSTIFIITRFKYPRNVQFSTYISIASAIKKEWSFDSIAHGLQKKQEVGFYRPSPYSPYHNQFELFFVPFFLIFFEILACKVRVYMLSIIVNISFCIMA